MVGKWSNVWILQCKQQSNHDNYVQVRYLMLNVDLLSSPISLAGNCFFLFFGAVLLWSKLIFFTSMWQENFVTRNEGFPTTLAYVTSWLDFLFC